MRAVIVFEQTVLKFANQVERFRIAIKGISPLVKIYADDVIGSAIGRY